MNSTTQVVLTDVRVAYVDVFEPRATSEKEEPRYGVCVIIPKTDTDQIKAIRAAMIQAAIEGKASKFAGKILANPTAILHDGDTEKDDPDFAGCVYFNAKSRNRPGLIDSNFQEIIDPDAIYSGCYCNVDVGFYPYNHAGKKGVGAGLNNLMSLNYGERMAGGRSAAEAFAHLRSPARSIV